MGVSKNNGTPKSSVLIGFSIINHPFWDTPIFGNIMKHPYWSRWKVFSFSFDPWPHFGSNQLKTSMVLRLSRNRTRATNIPPFRVSKLKFQCRASPTSYNATTMRFWEPHNYPPCVTMFLLNGFFDYPRLLSDLHFLFFWGSAVNAHIMKGTNLKRNNKFL